MIFPCVRRANTKNTNTKYTSTAYDEVPERPNKWYIFEKRIVQGYQKWCWCTDDNSLIMMHWQYCYIPQSLCVCHLEYSLRALVQHPCNARVIYHKSFTTTQIEIVRPGVECFPDLLGIFLKSSWKFVRFGTNKSSFLFPRYRQNFKPKQKSFFARKPEKPLKILFLAPADLR